MVFEFALTSAWSTTRHQFVRLAGSILRSTYKLSTMFINACRLLHLYLVQLRMMRRKASKGTDLGIMAMAVLLLLLNIACTRATVAATLPSFTDSVVLPNECQGTISGCAETQFCGDCLDPDDYCAVTVQVGTAAPEEIGYGGGEFKCISRAWGGADVTVVNIREITVPITVSLFL